MTSGNESEQTQEQPQGEGHVPLYWELDWNRVLYVNSAIDDDFVRRVAPEILKLKQASAAPITVAIDSEGGYLSSLDSLHGLLTSPGQRGERWHILTVAMNRAQSAAATLLALGDYSFAYDHSRILFHPVRLDADELTAERAIYTASSLQRDDDRYAALLAEHNLIKIIWSFDELRRPALVEHARKRYPVVAERFRRAFGYVLGA
ncbi:MAG: ATP-dependent Clp protease proteolytic subunit, partial [Chloroflexi bacterium]|nr:ATP-dependent Clp protease proteolytic subunit [Chloroflexota bacterium]